MNDPILVAGATGRQGGAVTRHLLKYGQKVRALTRHPQKAEKLMEMGIEIAQGDLTDRLSIEKALDGVKRMFLVTTKYEEGLEAEIAQGMTAVDAARAAGIEHLVFSSVGSAHRNTGIPHFENKRQIEKRIRDLGLSATILRPVFFMENFASPWLLKMLQKGIVSLPLRASRKLAMVAVDNIGEYGAQAFMNPGKFIGEEIELGGDELTFPQALRMISKAAGRDIGYRVISTEDAEKRFGHESALMYKWFDDVGYNPDIPELENKYHIPLIKFADYLRTAPWLEQAKIVSVMNEQ
jgi:uncharacterized protein YbjT (DUF2867 family)